VQLLTTVRGQDRSDGKNNLMNENSCLQMGAKDASDGFSKDKSFSKISSE
jgi:hypothetical protein